MRRDDFCLECGRTGGHRCPSCGGSWLVVDGSPMDVLAFGADRHGDSEAVVCGRCRAVTTDSLVLPLQCAGGNMPGGSFLLDPARVRRLAEIAAGADAGTRHAIIQLCEDIAHDNDEVFSGIIWQLDDLADILGLPDAHCNWDGDRPLRPTRPVSREALIELGGIIGREVYTWDDLEGYVWGDWNAGVIEWLGRNGFEPRPRCEQCDEYRYDGDEDDHDHA